MLFSRTLKLLTAYVPKKDIINTVKPNRTKNPPKNLPIIFKIFILATILTTKLILLSNTNYLYKILGKQSKQAKLISKKGFFSCDEFHVFLVKIEIFYLFVTY